MEIIARISQIFHQTKIALFPLEESLGEDFMAEVQRGALKGFRLACGMAIVAGLSFALVYELIFPARSYELLPLMAAMVLVGMMGIVFSLLFEPEFVAEDGRIRTRWGLATSRQILLQHQGQLDLESTPGKGTSVKVLLPVRELREAGEEK